MSIPRGTTPTLTLTFTESGLNLMQATNVYVTIRFGMQQITKTGEDLTIQPKSIALYLTQEETLQFPEGNIYIQANWTAAGGKRCASEIVAQPFSQQLLNEVLA